MTDDGAEPSVETDAKIVSFGENVSVADWTFLSGPSAFPTERSVTLTDGAGADVGASATGAAVGVGAGVSAFLQALNATREANTSDAAITAARMRVVISSSPCERQRLLGQALIGNAKPPARLDQVGVLHHVSI